VGEKGGYRGVRWSKKKGVKRHKYFLKNKTQKMNELKLQLNINNKIYALCMKKTSQMKLTTNIQLSMMDKM
jgi:hypothetical protein